MEPQQPNQEPQEEIDWQAREQELARKAGVAVEVVHSVRLLVTDVLNAEQEKMIALRYGLPVEKVRELGGVTAALLEKMLDEADRDEKQEQA